MLSLTVTAVPGLAIEGSGKVNMTEAQTEFMEKTSISIMSDGGGVPAFITFNESLNYYRELPSMAGNVTNNYAGTTILDVHFTPLADVCTGADNLLNDINDSFIESITQMLSNLEEVGVKVHGLSSRAACTSCNTWAKRFPPIGTNLDEFEGEWDLFRSNVTSQLRHIIPDIRSGTGTGEKDLAALLLGYETSVFALETSSEFLIRRNREISAVFYLSESFPEDVDDEGDMRNIVMYDYDSATDVDNFLRHEHVIVLELRILSSAQLTWDFLEGEPQDETGFWFNDLEINGRIGSLVRKLRNFAWENDKDGDKGYLVKLEELKEGSEDIKVQAYSGKLMMTSDFQIPTAPKKPEIYHISHDSVKLKVKVLNEFTTGAEVTITNAYGTATDEPTTKTFMFADLQGSGDEREILFKGLSAVSLYTATVKYVTDYGRSPPSPASLRFITAPSSPPTDVSVKCADVTTDSLKVTWAPPETMGVVPGLRLEQEDLGYKVVINGEHYF